jgi:hypothetical protein
MHAKHVVPASMPLIVCNTSLPSRTRTHPLPRLAGAASTETGRLTSPAYSRPHPRRLAYHPAPTPRIGHPTDPLKPLHGAIASIERDSTFLKQLTNLPEAEVDELGGTASPLLGTLGV